MKVFRSLPGLLVSIFLLMVLAADAFSAELMVTRGFSGAWDQIDQESQGVNIQIIAQDDDSRVALAYWYTYGSDRKSAWYLGIGQIIEDHIDFDLYHSEDVGFLEDGKPGNDSVQSIGTMNISFQSCSRGVVTFDTDHPEVGNGSFNIERLTEIRNMHCSGGISDDTDTMGMFGEQRIELLSAREGITASGHAFYEIAPGRSHFEIETEDLPDGDYHLYVGMHDRGEFTVSGGRGKLEFSSPMETGRRLLSFDPLGMQIRIHDGAGEVLSSFDGIFERGSQGHYGDHDHDFDCQSETGSGMGHGGSHGMNDCVEDGEAIEIEIDLTNTGQLPGAQGEAEWEMTTSHIEFYVEIENIPAGNYPLVVGGAEVGIIVAREMRHSGVFGRIKFRDPQTYNGYHLDFDPRGQTIEVMRQGNVILMVNFPEE
jgi:hypothetical protein